VVDADIKGAFDNISHEFLLKTIGNFPARELIKQWLKAGYVEDGVFHNTESGTPQGGIVSPLLANIALHGMEDVLGVTYKYNSAHKLWQTCSKRAVVRYADDFVVFCETKEDAQAAQETIEKWLEVRGLSLSNEKTKIVHLSEGFDFLGFNIRHYKDPTTKTGWKLLIKPSKTSLQKIRDQLRNIWLNGKGCPAGGVIRRLNPIIRGQANYYRIAVSSQAFQALDRWMYIRAIRFSKYAHPTKSTQWLHQKYWGQLNLDKSDRWVFGDKRSGVYLLKYTWFPVKRHVPVKGKASPDDPTLRDYWRSQERLKSSELLPSLQKIAKHQNWKCRVCGESLFNGEEMHIHHKTPRSQGGKDTYKNLELVHLLCHQQIHFGEGGSS
jgi:RNA-directed DNA polymerase